MHQSIATIDSPQFLNLQPLDLNPLMSKCEIKILYTGGNRNGSFITHQVAQDMAKTLRGAPIVGYFREEAQDFGDHGQKIIIQNGEIKFECKTKPYGFIPTDARIWFQNFDELDEGGSLVTREYLMSDGYLWTGQYEECADVVKSGRPQSMELDEKTMKGEWEYDNKSNMDFFIIHDAIFSKLCILGNAVQPCFEGASVAPASHFTIMDTNFTKTLYEMIQDMKAISKGGVRMDELKEPQEIVEEIEEQPIADFKKKEEEKEEEKKPAEDEKSEEETSEEKSSDSEEEDEDKKKKKKEEDYACDKKKKYELLETENVELQNQLNELQAKYSALEENYQALVEFKNDIENQKKDELINSFYMLSDEDKQDVVANKTTYSYDDIEAKLCVMCVRKGVSFTKEEETRVEEPVVLFQLNDNEEDNVPAFVKSLRKNKKD